MQKPYIVIPGHQAAYTIVDRKLQAYPIFEDTGVVDTKHPIPMKREVFASKVDLLEDLLLMLAHIDIHTKSDEETFTHDS